MKYLLLFSPFFPNFAQKNNSMRNISLLTFLLAVVFLYSCKEQPSDALHSAYYWTTTYKMSPEKADFITKHHVKRLYMRFFDVVMDPHGKPVPNATIEFIDTIPDSLEIVPTVYVLNECMSADLDDLAEKITKRVLQMCETHHINNVHEIQLDCDWTRRTQDRYFAFLETVRNRLKEKSKTLSITIRLHQLSMAVPPVDRGVLMVYNTGDVTDRTVKNPILDIEDVKPYMPYLKNYELPLVAAYPVFSWDVIFRGNRFIGIKHNEYEYPELEMDTVITYRPTHKEIEEVKNLIDKVSPDINNEIIIYDLSDKNLKDIPFTY